MTEVLFQVLLNKNIWRMIRKSVVTRVLALGVAAFTFTSCEEGSLGALTDTLGNLSQGDTASALKEALGLGVQTAVKKLSSDGYIAEAATKIGVPPEAVTAFEIYNELKDTPAGSAVVEVLGFGDDLEKNMIQAFNDAATDAAPKSAKILADEITSLSITDAEAILFGADNAATVKMQNDCQEDLKAAFHPTITNSMNNVKVGNMTATELWSKYATGNNKLYEWINSTTGQIALKGIKATGAVNSSTVNKISSVAIVDSDVSNYITGRALDGLFLKIAEKEKGIRSNAAERTSDLLKRVFGQLDK